MAEHMSTDNPASSEHPSLGSGHPVVSSTVHDLSRADSPHAPRFRAVTLVLVVIAVVAVAIAIVVAANGKSANGAVSPADWASWTPDNSGSIGTSEIAQHLAPYYRASSAQQLDDITPVRLSQTTAAGTTTGTGLTVAVNDGSSRSLTLLKGMTVAYDVCGLGAKGCELAGTPSVDRMLLLRREALQLALYTFEYISGSENVVIVLPPGHTVTSTGASEKGVTVTLLFFRKLLQPLLQVPLSRSLPQYPLQLSQLSSWSKTGDAGLVHELTTHWLFSSQVEPLQVGGSALVLSAMQPQ